MISKWKDCGSYFGYMKQSCIEWSSNPIIFNKKKKLVGTKKCIKLGTKPIHRTKLDDYGKCVCIIPSVLYTRDKNTIYPTLGFQEFVYSMLCQS